MKGIEKILEEAKVIYKNTEYMNILTIENKAEIKELIEKLECYVEEATNNKEYEKILTFEDKAEIKELVERLECYIEEAEEY